MLPQVLPRFWASALYRLDINFRESAVIGVVVAGGIGAASPRRSIAINTRPGKAAIVLLIAGLVLVAELTYGFAPGGCGESRTGPTSVAEADAWRLARCVAAATALGGGVRQRLACDVARHHLDNCARRAASTL
ncbi:MAG: hypothetical protein U0V87_04465 [Acidobacteriota bacterium]